MARSAISANEANRSAGAVAASALLPEQKRSHVRSAGIFRSAAASTPIVSLWLQSGKGDLIRDFIEEYL
jgi:hypothetical protein